jgi:hypothetical protein
MAKKLLLLPALALLLMAGFSCKSRVILPAGVASKIKVVKGQSINVRELPDAQSRVIGAALTNEVYTVVDAIPTYYLIRLPNNKQGWIYANVAEKWTSLVDENVVRINLEGGISVRAKPYDVQGPGISVAPPDFTFDVLDTVYSHYKIQLPNGRKGWVYAGTPDDKWVKPVY